MSRSILIVEDSEDDALLLQRMFNKVHIQNAVHVVANANDALAYLDSGNACPGIIFVDIKCPESAA